MYKVRCKMKSHYYYCIYSKSFVDNNFIYKQSKDKKQSNYVTEFGSTMNAALLYIFCEHEVIKDR